MMPAPGPDGLWSTPKEHDLIRADAPKAVSTDALFGGRRVFLFRVPGAFARTCSAKLLPGFANNADAMKAAGIDDGEVTHFDTTKPGEFGETSAETLFDSLSGERSGLGPVVRSRGVVGRISLEAFWLFGPLLNDERVA
jgi:hypothetical protein